jgi:hypothetical protein
VQRASLLYIVARQVKRYEKRGAQRSQNLERPKAIAVVDVEIRPFASISAAAL